MITLKSLACYSGTGKTALSDTFAFAASTASYTIPVANTKANDGSLFCVLPVTSDSNATVTVVGPVFASGSVTTGTISVASGTTSAPLTLSESNNTVLVVVKSQDLSLTGTYTLVGTTLIQ